MQPEKPQRVTKAVIPAAGLGTRFLPATKAMPKEMLPILDKPAIQYIVEEAMASGIEDLLIITGRGKRAIEDHFDRALELERLLSDKGQQELLSRIRDIGDTEIHYVRQKQPRGLGHAILCARAFIGPEPFGVLLGDDLVVNEGLPALRQLMDLYTAQGGTIVAVQEVPAAEVSRYGIIQGQEVAPGLYRLERLVEKPDPGEAPSRLAIMGRYCISPAIFPILAQTTPGAGGEVQLTDALNALAASEPVFAYRFQGRRFDAGDLLGYLETMVEFALMRPDVSGPFRRFLQGVLAPEARDQAPS